MLLDDDEKDDSPATSTKQKDSTHVSDTPSAGKEEEADPIEVAYRTTRNPAIQIVPGSLVAFPNTSEWLLQGLTEPHWRKALATEFVKPYFRDLADSLYIFWVGGQTFCPFLLDIFAAFNLCPLPTVRLVLTTPYISEPPFYDYLADGLAYSVKVGAKPSKTLEGMLASIKVKRKGSNAGNLAGWAKQGVFLLNNLLTVERVRPGEKGKPLSHDHIGWQVRTR